MDFLVVLGSQVVNINLSGREKACARQPVSPAWSQRLHLTGGLGNTLSALIIKSGPCKMAGVGGIKSSSEYGTAPAVGSPHLFCCLALGQDHCL